MAKQHLFKWCVIPLVIDPACWWVAISFFLASSSSSIVSFLLYAIESCYHLQFMRLATRANYRVRFQIAAICHWGQQIRKFSKLSVSCLYFTGKYSSVFYTVPILCSIWYGYSHCICDEMYLCTTLYWCTSGSWEDLWGVFYYNKIHSSIGNGFARCNALREILHVDF